MVLNIETKCLLFRMVWAWIRQLLKELTDNSLHFVYFQNARTLQSVSMVSSMAVIKLLAVCLVVVVSNIEGGGL